MRKITLLLLTIMGSLSLRAQYASERHYRWSTVAPMRECDPLGNPINAGDIILAPRGAKFTILYPKSADSLIIEFWKWKTDTASFFSFNVNREQYNNLNSSQLRGGNFGEARKFFIVSKTMVDSNATQVYSTRWKESVFTIGVVTMPVKMRLRNFDFQGNFSIGTTAGVKKRISKYSNNFINLLGGVSLSTVNLDSSSTQGRVPTQPINNVAALSPSLGIVFQFGNAQAGVFMGVDLLSKSNRTKYGWIYHGKPWISVGFGFSIFTMDGTAGSGNKTEQ
jgi:hypothetical protein